MNTEFEVCNFNVARLCWIMVPIPSWTCLKGRQCRHNFTCAESWNKNIDSTWIPKVKYDGGIAGWQQPLTYHIPLSSILFLIEPMKRINVIKYKPLLFQERWHEPHHPNVSNPFLKLMQVEFFGPCWDKIGRKELHKIGYCNSSFLWDFVFRSLIVLND